MNLIKRAAIIFALIVSGVWVASVDNTGQPGPYPGPTVEPYPAPVVTRIPTITPIPPAPPPP